MAHKASLKYRVKRWSSIACVLACLLSLAGESHAAGWQRLGTATEGTGMEADIAAVLSIHRTRFQEEALGNLSLPTLSDSPDLQDLADRLLADQIQIQGVHGSIVRLAGGRIDWNDRGPKDDPEWAWLLNRHSYFQILLGAWVATGDDRYRDRVLADLDDWIRANPYPDRLTFSSAWRPLEVARRIVDTWPLIWLHLRDDPAFSDEQQARFLESILDHADALRDHASFWGGNHLLTESSALAAIAAYFPAFKDASGWLQEAAGRFTRQLLKQTYPAGAYKELSNHYHLVVLREVDRFEQILEFSEHAESLEPGLADFRERVQAMWRYFAGVARPDGIGPLNNAADREDNRAAIAEARHVDWEQVRPETAVRRYPWAGHVVMTDDAASPTEWAFFDAGPLGSAHDHADRLQLNVYFAGGSFLADRGRYTYAPGSWSEYFKGPQAHNTLLIDGEAPLPGSRTVERPLPIDHGLEQDWMWFSAENAFRPDRTGGRGPARHRRTVIYLPRQAWLVIDQVLRFGPHEITTYWNFAPEVTESAARTHFRQIAVSDSLHRDASGVRFASGEISPSLGWTSDRYGVRQPALVRVEKLKSMGPGAILWAIVPRPEIEISTASWSATGGRIRVRISDSEDAEWLVNLRAGPPEILKRKPGETKSRREQPR